MNGLGSMDFMMDGTMRTPFSLYEAALNRAGMMADMKSLGTTSFVPTVSVQGACRPYVDQLRLLGQH